jgi:replicative DNA helicase
MTTTQNLPQTILVQLLRDDSYAKKVLPFIQPEYFEESEHKYIFTEIQQFQLKYKCLPTITALRLQLDQATNLNEKQFQQTAAAYDTLGECTALDATHEQWIIDQTEQFCQDRAVHNALVECIHIKESQTENRHSIPELLRKALSVSFDHHVGHDYIEDAEARFDFYHRVDNKLPFDLEKFNQITNGGLSPKTLNVLAAGTAVGKSHAMCHMSAAWLKAGHNVLYITLEMAEEKIAERIDANMFDVDISSVPNLVQPQFLRKIQNVKERYSQGRIIIKEYPATGAHASHFRHLIDELRLKKNFNPHVVIIDYLNICASVRFKPGNQVNSYTFVKAVAEELRGLGQELNVPILTATQFNRQGFASSEPGLENVSESFGLNMTADLIIALTVDDKMPNLITCKQLKNRYADATRPKKFVVEMDRSRMRLKDAPATAVEYLADSGDDEDDKVRQEARQARILPIRDRDKRDFSSGLKTGDDDDF